MSEESSHILSQFESDLGSLKENVLTMASQSRHNLAGAMKGLLERNSDLCNQVIADDEEVDQLEKSIDHDGMMLIAKYSPVARDLRRVVATMKMAQSLERVSDQATNIAKRARKINRNPAIEETLLLQSLYESVEHLLADSVSTFSKGDVEAALTFDDRDEVVDVAHKKLMKDLSKRMEADPGHIKDYIDLMFIVRFLERIGDYSVNIAEDTVYAESAYDVRHGGETPPVN